MYVSIHHENKAAQQTHAHTPSTCPFSKYANLILCAFVCVHARVYVVSRQAADIYGLHSG